ncbi:putative htrA2 peptidase [Helianthus annuus]|uniref:HtrA2 peptidase n=1 Tax=Helianthus annuus TaxID=4232 RepID=A0A9K3I7D7_HELAN|nr:protease Do-like 7 isoform X2 [Helianthus annuus]KAF5791475.1 putative htrA2 peptidase [Helianthus annuus]KAJ0526537.1 putative htrA2 peptidase [Helianthus annuus]KAJ0534989.1 putative htrA2 peptidase [Helianthus annuus]KAJ0542930.1 putative htrA2 peptidase [Helianthus annuus]KAJ0707985.1 putative htrA2 peptidase [Helianthus annuus]
MNDSLQSETNHQLSMELDPPFNESHATAEDWRKALHKVVPAVVVLRTTACRAFDTESAGASQATGLVVDKRRGIILTNRHVVEPGPVTAEAVFVNREEIPVYPIYRDPVHDFGFFRYDPGAVKFLSYEEIPLAPEAASVGLEIRVVGNDSGEKISILAGTLARLDRDAPFYKKDGYNDFNTFYIQAASGTKSGSSGSPVINWQGKAVALNAGGKTSSSSAFFFPLERVVRALNMLQKGRDLCQDKWEAVTIPRGTIQATFVHKGFDDTRRLGLQSETEELVRHASPPSETGMLVVDSVVPGGPAYDHLEPGDVLVRMNGEVITQFLKMETLLDDSVGKNVELEFERGGTSLTVQLVVEDLHSITPNYFLEVSGAVIHPLSYQQARNFRFNCGLVYVSDPGYMLYRAGVPRHAIIKRLADKDTSNLEDFINVLSQLSRGARVPLEYINYKDRHRKKSVLVTMDRHEWYASPQIYTRDDTSGIWIRKPALPSSSQLISSGITQVPNGVASMDTSSSEHVLEVSNNKDASADDMVIAEVEDSTSPGDHDTLADSGNASVAERVIEPTLVMFSVHVPSSCMVDGVHAQHFVGTGVIIFHSEEMGLVAVDKNTVAISASDVRLSFAAFPIEIPGEVAFLHPVHNYALIAYDPSLLGPAGNSVVRAAQLLPEPALRRGESVCLVGLNKSLQATSRKSVVTNPCAVLKISSADSPRYRATNMEVIELDTDFGSMFSGVLTDEHGRVKAIWGSFSTQIKYGASSSEDHHFTRGIHIYSISQVLNKIRSGAKGQTFLINGIKRPMPLVRVLEVEFYCTLLSKARSFGLSNNWIQALVKKDPVRRQVLRVKGCLAGSKAENLLEQGDMVLAINRKPVTCFNDVEEACHALDVSDDMDTKLVFTIFRQGREMEVEVGTDIRDGNGTTRVINWCGCLVQDPHPEVRALGFLPKEGHGVYVARWSSGSPVHRYGLYSQQWIVEVNGKPTPDLDAFVNVTKEIEDGEFVRVRTVHLNGKPRVLTLKQDLHYWPTWELRFDPETATWHRRIIKSLETGDSL